VRLEFLPAQGHFTFSQGMPFFVHCLDSLPLFSIDAERPERMRGRRVRCNAVSDDLAPYCGLHR